MVLMLNRSFVPVIVTFSVVFVLFTLKNLSTDTDYYSRNDEIENDADIIPGGYVKYLHPKPSNESYCTFNYGLPSEFKFVESDVNFGPELGKDGPYRILYNVVEAKLGADVPRVTYVTHVSANFVNYITELVRYFEGPISVAAFVPNYDSILVLEQLVQFCYCIPDMSRVSIHFVFHKDFPPLQIESGEEFVKQKSCDIADSSTLKSFRKYQKSMMYPINVCRNAARTAALTDFVMVSDIELMPSEGLASRFLRMLQNEKISESELLYKGFVVPIFEVDRNQPIPRSKAQLRRLISEEKAVYFHRLICSHCQKFPGIETWVDTDPKDRIESFNVVKREVPYNRWEPIYIGTKNEPHYNEALSWEGLQDKMLQMLEMCLIGYKLVILDGAFLVHWPGMKTHKTQKTETWREPFVKENQRQYNKILRLLSGKYEANPKCKLK